MLAGRPCYLLGIGLPKLWCWRCLVGAPFVLVGGFLEAVVVVGLMVGMASVDAMSCAMFPLIGIDSFPDGYVMLVTGEVAVSGLGAFLEVGLPLLELVMLFSPSVLGCLLAMRMPIWCLKVESVECRRLFRTPRGLALSPR